MRLSSEECSSWHKAVEGQLTSLGQTHFPGKLLSKAKEQRDLDDSQLLLVSRRVRIIVDVDWPRAGTVY